ncbi:T9SS type A sorting domain-containing protein [candidate division KSB1 bacterium]|nr:T9SS type A sorting domain-containing protein [candidate division KSB1 bacterium]
MRTLLAVSMLALLLAFAGPPPTCASTWQTLQDRIFTPQCAVCHVAGSSFAVQSGLVLTDDVAYENLVDVSPHNSAALEDGLVRVSSIGVTGLDQSFLWEKINAPHLEHFYEAHPYYGEIMPLGLPFLTNGELEYVRQWIVAGAPQQGDVADTAVFADTSRFVQPLFAPLEPPAFGEQLRVGPFDVASNYEREFFYYNARADQPERYINRVQIVMRPGSHHFICYTFAPNTPGWVIPQPEVIRDIRDENGNYIPQNLIAMQFHDFFAGTQWPRVDYRFPPGIALRLPAGTGIDQNSHNVNYTDTLRQGEVYTNLYYAEPAGIEHVAEVLNLQNTNLTLPPHEVTTISRTYTFHEQLSVFQLFSHAHQLMTEFRATIVGGPRDGELIYLTQDWEHPPILNLDPPVVFEAGQGIRCDVTYNNWREIAVHFGLTSEDEMMILFGYYYPGVSAADEPPMVAHDAELLGNYPNPFNPSTTILYVLNAPQSVRLQVFDLTGRLVATLVNGPQQAGDHRVSWNGMDANGVAAPSGVYFYTLEAGIFSDANKMLLLK